jgi:hypothetical protein
LVLGILGQDVVGSTATLGGFTVIDSLPEVSGTNFGMTLAYLAQASGAAVSPTWTPSASADLASVLGAVTGQ